MANGVSPTSSLDDLNIKSENIAKGVDIFGVTGSHQGKTVNCAITTSPSATVYYTEPDGSTGSGVADSTGSLKLTFSEYGTYSFYAVLDGIQTDTVTTTFSEPNPYDVPLPIYTYKYYGVKIAKGTSDPATALTYMDDAVGMSTGWSAWKDTNIFKDIRPCVVKDGVVQYYLNPNNYALRADGTSSTINSTSAGDVMIEIPKLGYKMTSDSSYHYIWVTDDPEADGYCYAAHSKNSVGDCDYIYVGAYLGCVSSSKLYSISGVSPTASTTLTNFRTYATNRGSNYELFSFYPMTLLQCMFLIMFKNRNSQSALGQGYTGARSKSNTGATNSNTFTYGSTSSTTHVKFLGIEDFWGNLYYWVDGLYASSNALLTYYKNMSGTDSGSNYQYSMSVSVPNNGGYFSDIAGTNNGGFVPTAFNGSSSTYYADDGILYAGYCAIFGGHWNYGADAGAFLLNVVWNASGSSSAVGARLLLKHPAS